MSFVSAPLATPPLVPSLRRDLVRLWEHLAPKRRFQLVALLGSMLASGLAEAVSVAAMVPFLTVLTAPDRLWQIGWVRQGAMVLGIADPAAAIVPMTIAFAGLAVAAAVVRITNLWLCGRVLAGLGSDLSCAAYRRALLQPYAMHVSRNSSSVIHAVTAEVSRLVNVALQSILQMAVSLVVIVCIVATLLALSPWVAVVTVGLLAAAYLGLAQATRASLVSMGQQRTAAGREVVKTVQEGLGGIRDVILGQSYSAYLKHYQQHDWPLRQATVRESLVTEFPVHAVTAAAVVAMAVLASFSVAGSGGISGALPMLGLLAMGAQRLLPAVQMVYACVGRIRGSAADIEGVLTMLEAPIDESLLIRHPPAPFAESLGLDGVSFRYGTDGPWVLSNVSLTIAKGSRVAIVGPSGSGKSTLADILMGLLPPTTGRLLIDGRVVSSGAWQANIAHVPQAIFLADATIAENIALGIPPDEVNQHRLHAAAAQAQIGDFIESLPQGYATAVGERGIRLSGGQRQRIGIARALYQQTPVLIFDEATSALDDATEKAVMETLDGLSRDLTIIMIAHRISTTAYCDRVIAVAAGEVRESAAAQPTIA